MTKSSTTDCSQSALEAFRKVSQEFFELCRSDKGDGFPIWGGNWNYLKYIFKHPINGYGRLLSGSFQAQSRVGTLAPFFPLETMVASLSQYSESQLKTIKNLSEVQLRRVKATVTDNPAFKIGVPIGAAYGLLEIGNKLVTSHDTSLESLREFIASPLVQHLIGGLFVGFMLSLSFFAILYLFFIGPTIARAQLLDDILLVAIEEKRFMDSIAPTPRSQPEMDAQQLKQL